MTKDKHLNLPHMDMQGHYQFVTSRTKESLDRYLKQLYASNELEKIKQYKMDRYLDTGIQGAFLYGELIQKIQKYFLSYMGKSFDLCAVSIMPNHIHVLFKQNGELSDVMRILKGGSAHIINTSLNRKGKVWSSDYFDKLIRDEEHFSLVYKYIKYNAVKAGLDDEKDRFYGCYE